MRQFNGTGTGAGADGAGCAVQQERDAQEQAALTYLQPDSVEQAEVAIIETAIAVLEQPLRMLRSGDIGDRELRHMSKLIPGSSPGKHLRHVHDHLRILVTALHEAIAQGSPSHPQRYPASSPPTNSGSSMQLPAIQVDYDQRSSIPSLETSTEACGQAFEQIQHRLRRLISFSEETGQRGKLFEREVQLSATTPVPQTMRTTVGRELWFASLHSIHHYALARVILAHELNVDVDPNFGFAPSTITRRKARVDGSASSSAAVTAAMPGSTTRDAASNTAPRGAHL